MAELLKIKLTGATAAEQSELDSVTASIVVLTLEDPEKKADILEHLQGKEEILKLIRQGIPQGCFLGLYAFDSIEDNPDGTAQALYFSKLAVIRYPETLAKYDVLPTSPALYFFNAAITHHNKGRPISTTKNGTKQSNRHQVIEYTPTKSGYIISQKNTQTGQVLEIAFSNTDKLRGKGVKKCFAFLLSQSNQQHFRPIIGFSLTELVDRGMYSSTENARRGIKAALDTLQNIKFSGTIKKGNRKTIEQAEAGVLFYHYKIKNNYVEVSVNENFNLEFIAAYYALFPQFAYSLSNGDAFDLCEYIFMQARTNSQAIKQSGKFTVSFRRIRELLALPEEKDITNKRNWKPKQYVIAPILTAINDLQSEAEKAAYKDFTINTVYNSNYANLAEFLDGYIEISFSGEVFESITKIAEQQEARIAVAMQQREKRIANQKAAQ